MSLTVLHLGLGAFHRAHQAVYLQRLSTATDSPWRITAGNLRPEGVDMAEVLARQGHAYNVGSNLGLSISELAHLVRDTIAPSKQVKIMGDNGKDQAHRNLYIPNVEKAKNELGLGLTISLAEAIRLTASKKSDL